MEGTACRLQWQQRQDSRREFLARYIVRIVPGPVELDPAEARESDTVKQFCVIARRRGRCGGSRWLERGHEHELIEAGTRSVPEDAAQRRRNHRVLRKVAGKYGVGGVESDERSGRTKLAFCSEVKGKVAEVFAMELEVVPKPKVGVHLRDVHFETRGEPDRLQPFQNTRIQREAQHIELELQPKGLEEGEVAKDEDNLFERGAFEGRRRRGGVTRYCPVESRVDGGHGVRREMCLSIRNVERIVKVVLAGDEPIAADEPSDPKDDEVVSKVYNKIDDLGRKPRRIAAGRHEGLSRLMNELRVMHKVADVTAVTIMIRLDHQSQQKKCRLKAAVKSEPRGFACKVLDDSPQYRRKFLTLNCPSRE
ncbi:hypothetical protein DFH09DRAFT_1083867 [Mycena vulgaris]|nr:hypothetical protein DFH09DRAFT_1083867 [Mycena vulgaris]